MKFIYEIIFLVAIIGIADTQADMIANGQTIRHFWWGLLFGLLIAGAVWLENRDYWFAGSLILEHFVFFSPALNFLRKPRKPFFYIHSDPKSGSIWDKLGTGAGKFYPFIWAAGLIAFALIQSKL